MKKIGIVLGIVLILVLLVAVLAPFMIDLNQFAEFIITGVVADEYGGHILWKPWKQSLLEEAFASTHPKQYLTS